VYSEYVNSTCHFITSQNISNHIEIKVQIETNSKKNNYCIDFPPNELQEDNVIEKRNR
jgi:hypothetical protein